MHTHHYWQDLLQRLNVKHSSLQIREQSDDLSIAKQEVESVLRCQVYQDPSDQKDLESIGQECIVELSLSEHTVDDSSC